jgi:hypothetical protein
MSEEKIARETTAVRGWIAGLPFGEYQEMPGINASSIAYGRKSMLHMHHAMTEPGESTPAMALGALCHYVILEGDAGLVVCEARRGTRAWQDAIDEACGDERLVCKPADYDAARRMRDKVMACRDAVWLIGRTEHEVSATWPGKYGIGKARPDMRNDWLIADYKTTGDITPFRFFGVAERLGYHVKMGWYAEGYEAIDGKLPEVYIIAQEARPPHDCWVCTMRADVIAAGRAEAAEIALRYRVHAMTNRFPGVVPDGEIIEYERPSWTLGGENAEVNMEGVAEL